jgi:hypothetical protein
MVMVASASTVRMETQLATTCGPWNPTQKTRSTAAIAAALVPAAMNPATGVGDPW